MEEEEEGRIISIDDRRRRKKKNRLYKQKKKKWSRLRKTGAVVKDERIKLVSYLIIWST